MKDPLAYIYTVVGAIQKMVSTTEVAELNGYRNPYRHYCYLGRSNE